MDTVEIKELKPVAVAAQTHGHPAPETDSATHTIEMSRLHPAVRGGTVALAPRPKGHQGRNKRKKGFNFFTTSREVHWFMVFVHVVAFVASVTWLVWALMLLKRGLEESRHQ